MWRAAITRRLFGGVAAHLVAWHVRIGHAVGHRSGRGGLEFARDPLRRRRNSGNDQEGGQQKVQRNAG